MRMILLVLLLALALPSLSACDAVSAADAPMAGLPLGIERGAVTGVSLPRGHHGGGAFDPPAVDVRFRPSTAELHVDQYLFGGLYVARLVNRSTGAVLDSKVVELYDGHHDWVTADFGGTPPRTVAEGTELGLELSTYPDEGVVYESAWATISQAAVDAGEVWFGPDHSPDATGFLMLLPG